MQRQAFCINFFFLRTWPCNLWLWIWRQGYAAIYSTLLIQMHLLFYLFSYVYIYVQRTIFYYRWCKKDWSTFIQLQKCFSAKRFEQNILFINHTTRPIIISLIARISELFLKIFMKKLVGLNIWWKHIRHISCYNLFIHRTLRTVNTLNVLFSKIK